MNVQIEIWKVTRTLSLVVIGLLLSTFLTAAQLMAEVDVDKASGNQPQWISVDDEQGPSGYALEFDGVSNFVRVPNHPSLEPKTEMTIELWAWIDGPQKYCSRLLRKAGGLKPGYLLAADQGDRRMQIRFDGVTNGPRTIRAADNVLHTERTGTWHHFAGVYAKEYVAFYVDGRLIDKQTHRPGDLRHSPIDLYIGYGIFGNEYFKGMIDEVRIWNVARTEQQIEANMNQSVAADSAGLAAYWKFDEGQGDIAHDSTSNQNHGHLEFKSLSRPKHSATSLEDIKNPAFKAENLPGKLIFHGRYRHRSRNRDIDTPGELWIKQGEGGNLTALARLLWMGSYDLASGDTSGRLKSYQTGKDGAYNINLELQGEKVLLTRRGVRADCDDKKLSVPGGAYYNPNTRPDSYCADNIFLRGLNLEPGQSKEFHVYDWDNSGEALADYAIQITHAGKEVITVPAGTFKANHLVLKQLTSTDTWFKKRAGHITEYWVLDSGVIVCILRHREPYELQLLDYTFPEELDGKIVPKSVSAKDDPLTGYFRIQEPQRKNANPGTIIPVFKIKDTYYSVCRGMEIPFKKCPGGLEWALQTSMIGTTIGCRPDGNYFIIIRDAQSENFTSESEAPHNTGPRPMVRIDKPSSILDSTAPAPQTNDGFLGYYQPQWFPYYRMEIRKEKGKYYSVHLSPEQDGKWIKREGPSEIIPLENELGFVYAHRKQKIITQYNKDLKRYELVMAHMTPELRMPLVRVEQSTPAAELISIGIPSWH